MIRVVLAAVLLATPRAWAAGTIPRAPVKQDTSDERYANDLDGGDRHKRLFAARVLLRRTAEAARVGNRATVDIQVMEARQRLSDFDRLVAPKCLRLLNTANIARPCAKMLGLLETAGAVDALEDLAASDAGFCTRRAARRALKRIGSEQ